MEEYKKPRLSLKYCAKKVVKKNKINETSKLRQDIAELKEEITKLKMGHDDNQINKIQVNVEHSGRWEPVDDEPYWYIDDIGCINSGVYHHGNSIARHRLLQRNVYKTEFIARKMRKYYQALENTRWYPNKSQWLANIPKYYGYYNHISGTIGHLTTMQFQSNIPVFLTKEKCIAFYHEWYTEALIDWGIIHWTE